MSKVEAKFDRIVSKISKGIGSYKRKLDNIISDKKDFLESITDLIDAMIDIIKVFINMLDIFVDFSDFVVLFIPATMIFFVVSKLTQVL
jgi:hypothetical protein